MQMEIELASTCRRVNLFKGFLSQMSYPRNPLLQHCFSLQAVKRTGTEPGAVMPSSFGIVCREALAACYSWPLQIYFRIEIAVCGSATTL